MVGEWKSGKIEKILISLIFVWLGVKKLRDRKSEFIWIYLYTIVKNDAQLK